MEICQKKKTNQIQLSKKSRKPETNTTLKAVQISIKRGNYSKYANLIGNKNAKASERKLTKKN